MVRRNELNQQRVDIPPHELPVLAYVHGEEQCRVTDELIVDRDIPDAAEEYQRLAQKYGRDKANESLEPRVSAVYGAGGRGVLELGRAIEYGQRDDVPVESFILGNNEPAHEQKGASVLQKTQHRPMAHAEAPRAANKPRRRAAAISRNEQAAEAKRVERNAPRPRRPAVDVDEGRENVHELAGAPAAMRPGRSETLRNATQKQKREAVSGNGKKRGRAS